MEYETLDRAEVQSVIKGEPIRSIAEVLKEDLAESERLDDVQHALETHTEQPYP